MIKQFLKISFLICCNYIYDKSLYKFFHIDRTFIIIVVQYSIMKLFRSFYNLERPFKNSKRSAHPTFASR